MNDPRSTFGRLRAAHRLMAPGVHMPVYAIVFVTSRCDARCRHCFYWQELNQVQGELTIDEFDRLARSLGPVFQITLTGGSPELRTDLAAIARSFWTHTRPVNMTLCLLGRHTERVLRQVQEILLTCPGLRLTVGLSLDGLAEEHDAVRGCAGLFDRVVATCRGLGELKKSYPQLTVHAAVTISTLNHHSAERTAQWAREHLPIDGLKPILVRGSPADPAVVSEASRAPYLRLVESERARPRSAESTRPSLVSSMIDTKESVERELIEEILTRRTAPLACSAARETVVIHPDGRVAGCELRPETLGHLREHQMALRPIWRSRAADEFRRTAGRVEVCQGCYHHCFLSPAMFRTPLLWPRLARSWLQATGAARAAGSRP